MYFRRFVYFTMLNYILIFYYDYRCGLHVGTSPYVYNRIPNNAALDLRLLGLRTKIRDTN